MKEQILQLRSEGKTYNEIKKLTGASKGTISYHLGDKQKDKYRSNNLRRRAKGRAWRDALKSTLKCEKCGEDRYWLLDFHHVDPSTKENHVSQMFKRTTKEKVMEEIAKCQVLCSNCHRDLHYQEKMLKL